MRNRKVWDLRQISGPRGLEQTRLAPRTQRGVGEFARVELEIRADRKVRMDRGLKGLVHTPLFGLTAAEP